MGLTSGRSSGAGLKGLFQGFQSEVSAIESRQRAAAAQKQLEFQEEQQNRRYAMQLRNNLLEKAAQYMNEAEKTAAVDAKTWNQAYWNKGANYIKSLRDEHPFKPDEWLKPDNAWKLTPESQKKAQAYVSDVNNIEAEYLAATPADFTQFHDPASILRKPANNLWTPEFSEDYKRELAKKGTSTEKADDPLDTEYKQLRNAKIKKGLNAPPAADKDAIRGLVKTRQQYLGEYGKYQTTGQQLQGYYKKYGGADDWLDKAVSDEGLKEDKSGNVELVGIHAKNKQSTSEKFGEFLGYLRDSDAISGAVNIPKEKAEGVVEFLDTWGEKFNGLQSADDIDSFTDWIGARNKGMGQYKDRMSQKTIKAPKFFNDDEKEAASIAYELITNRPLK